LWKSDPPSARRAARRTCRGRARSARVCRAAADESTGRTGRRRISQLLPCPTRLACICGPSRFGRKLQAIKRALSGERLRRVDLPNGGSEEGVDPQCVVIDEILISESEAEDALGDEFQRRVLDEREEPAVP